MYGFPESHEFSPEGDVPAESSCPCSLPSATPRTRPTSGGQLREHGTVASRAGWEPVWGNICGIRVELSRRDRGHRRSLDEGLGLRTDVAQWEEQPHVRAGKWLLSLGHLIEATGGA